MGTFKHILYNYSEPSISTEDVERLKDTLDALVIKYENPAFIETDPIQFPINCDNQRDKEIMGLFAALFAKGRRGETIKTCELLFEVLNQKPFEFINKKQPNDFNEITTIKHRTFLPEDLAYFLTWFKWFYSEYDSLEDAFTMGVDNNPDQHVGPNIEAFYQIFHNPGVDLGVMQRTKKHISTPKGTLACKRINLFLRWMVRPTYNKDGIGGVDLGLWKTIKPSQLVIPLDVHVMRVAQSYGLLQKNNSKQEVAKWKDAIQLTSNLRLFDAEDPVRYDYALFGKGVNEKLSSSLGS